MENGRRRGLSLRKAQEVLFLLLIRSILATNKIYGCMYVRTYVYWNKHTNKQTKIWHKQTI